MGRKTIIYRGSLKSCNYKCSYCPFSKHRPSPAELERDRGQFARFCDSLESRARKFSIGAVFVAPYGEASLHDWYWEGLGRLSGRPEIHRVGMQTNLSFSIDKRLEVFGSCGGKREKLCIWASFHPEMTDVDTFVSQCHRLAENGIRVCAGAVGVPGNIPLLWELREKLPETIYLWINKMDGLRRNYTEGEIRALSGIDFFFTEELKSPAADLTMCVDRCFVEADGKMRTCNISGTKGVNWYDGGEAEIFEPLCGRKRCTCYLAYGGRSDFTQGNIFGEYPLFRIPEKFEAVFLDLDGTLVRRKRGRGLSDEVRGRLAALGEISPLFLNTSMPAGEAVRLLQADMELFQGGIFASGGYLYLKKGNEAREKVYPVGMENLSDIEQFAKESMARIKLYGIKNAVYKATLVKRHNAVWSDAECHRMAELLAKSACRFFTEGNCLEIVDKGRDKGAGIAELCGWLGISPGDVLAVGNDGEDAAMEKVCGGYIKI